MPFRLSTCALLAIVCSAAAPAAQQTPLLLAVSDGARLWPVARYQGARWQTTCDLPANRARPADSPAPRVVVSEGAIVEAARRVPTGSAEWRPLEPVVKALFDTHARRENVSAAALAAVPFRIEAIFSAAHASPAQLYYFMASKTVPDGRGDIDADDDGAVDPKGDLRIDVSGWLQHAGAIRPLGTNSTLSWEQVDDRPAGAGTRRTALTPIGIVRLAGQGLWVMQGRAGTNTWHAIYQVDADGVRMLVRTDSRGC